MQQSSYYRQQSERARRLALDQTSREAAGHLIRLAQQFEEVAEDIEAGSAKIRHPDLLRSEDAERIAREEKR
jgi:hypothetical protein